ncbi:MAG TPA: DNA-binding protein [Gammaproteobacteria bacterium]|nr:DNA-binding protein [Gammaproteobacteria bacterium]
MKAALVALDYQGLTVSFNEDGWFNATAVADRFGKRVDHYLANAETQNYIAALCEGENTRKVGDFVRAKRGRNGGTWFHPDLGVHFARWMDVRFAIWCDRQIRTLLMQQHPHFDWKRQRHEASASFKVMNDILAAVRTDQGKPTAAHHYINEARLVNWALAGEFKALDREALPIHELNLLAKLELKNATLIGRGVSYADRKKILESTALEARVVSSPVLPSQQAA